MTASKQSQILPQLQVPTDQLCFAQLEVICADKAS